MEFCQRKLEILTKYAEKLQERCNNHEKYAESIQELVSLATTMLPKVSDLDNIVRKINSCEVHYNEQT